MTHSISYILGFLTGILGVAAIAALTYWIILRRIGKAPCEYDERQEKARGKAFKAAYFTLLVYLCVYGVFELATGIIWCDTFTGVMIGICVSVSVFACMCIWNDAYISFRQKPIYYIALFSFLSLLNFFLAFMRGYKEGFVKNGMLQTQSTNLIVGVMLFFVLMVYIAKLITDKRKQEASDEES